MFLIFDTETTGLPKSWKAPLTDTDNWPRMVQLAWQMHDKKGNFIAAKNHVVYPDGYTIPQEVVKVHGITTEKAREIGVPLKTVLTDFMSDVAKSQFVIGHNVNFDINIVGCELVRMEMPEDLSKHPLIDTMEGSKVFCDLRKKGNLKNPTLTELHIKLFGIRFEEAHNAAADVEATSRCFLELIRVGGFYQAEDVEREAQRKATQELVRFSPADYEAFLKNNPKSIQAVGIKYEAFKEDIFEEFSLEEFEKKINRAAAANDEIYPFVHLHVHSQYSILDGLNKASAIAEKAFADGQPAVALTDHGNMFGIKEFHQACKNAKKNVVKSQLASAIAAKSSKVSPEEESELQAQIEARLPSSLKPILGIEAYCARRGHLRKDDKTDSSGYHLILLAKNQVGYVNLLQLTSIASTDGFYYKPRIDKELLKQHSEGLIVSSACLGGEISQHIMNGKLEEARQTVKWFKDIFGEDYYLEVSRHPNNDPILRRDTWENQAQVSQIILQLAAEFGVKVIATNDSHFTNAEDADPHDLLVCMNTGRDYDDPTRMRYSRQEWFKTRKEMSEQFADLPELLTNTIEIADKVEFFELDHAPFMPPFDIPEEFASIAQYKEKYDEKALAEEFSAKVVERLGGYEKTLQIKLEADYLEHLCFEGATQRYGHQLEASTKERLDFELNTIKTMGFPGYFLIVQDFINWAKNNGVLVGPGRGSAAGSAVAYCVKITDVDPIKYDLLFERFLNPDRISMPDVDIDFDDDGRQRVLDYVANKYGHDKVAHICTFGTMATKGSIKDVGRVLGLPIPESNRLTKLVGDESSFKKAYKNVPDFLAEKKSDNPTIRKTLQYAETLEGTVRQTGVHACGVLIGKNPLREHLPVMPTKGEELLTTQYDGRFVENIGLLKMDFLGLRTLSIIKETLENIKLSKGIDIDINAVDLDDEKTFQLFAHGETTAIFQFESPGMRKHLMALIPDRFEHLVAMNALYRPGPMEYIPDFIERRHGRQPVKYDHPLMEPYLKDTYGITVYQEQVMLQSRALGGFTRGDSDALRKAMGKKIIDMMNTLSVKFTDGCLANEAFLKACEAGEAAKNDPKELIQKIWKDWEAFASYAFNKSHSVCYAYIAYQTGYLKAHYPAEYMAGVMSRNLSDISKISTFMEECQRMGLAVKGPDINESYRKFTVNRQGVIRFGMAGVKGVGDSAVEEIIRERNENGAFKDVFDFVQRVNLKTVNKKSIESLANSGAFDGFGLKRAQFFATVEGSQDIFLDKLVRFGQQVQSEKASSMMSLFGDLMNESILKTPDIPQVKEFPNLVLLAKEKELIGIYLSAHPLDDYQLEFDLLVSKNYTLRDLNERIGELEGQKITFGGMVLEAEERMSKNGKPFAKMVLADYKGSYEIMLFGKDYIEFGKYCKPNIFILAKGEVCERFRSNNDDPNRPKNLRFKVQSMDLLDDALSKSTSSVTIETSLQSINSQLIKELVSYIKSSPGDKELKVKIWDADNNQSLILFSRNTRIRFNKKLERFLREHEHLSFKIN